MTKIILMTEPDREVARQLLRASKLPLDGFDAPHVTALVARDDGGAIVGSAAIEVYREAALLRSVAVADSHRGRGLGQELTRAALALARERGLGAVYLLTETAAAFFPKFGFTPVSRDAIPADVKTSVEFTTTCPASAQVFQLLFKGVPHER